ESRLSAFEQAMQRGTQLESELLAHQVHNIATQRSAGRLQIASCILGQVNDPMHAIDQNAGRSELLDGLPMQSRLAECNTGAECASNWYTLVPRAEIAEQARQQAGLVRGMGCRLIETCLAVNGPE